MKKTEIKDLQRPYAVLAANGAFEILNLPEAPGTEQPEVKPLVPQPDQPRRTRSRQCRSRFPSIRPKLLPTSRCIGSSASGSRIRSDGENLGPAALETLEPADGIS